MQPVIVSVNLQSFKSMQIKYHSRKLQWRRLLIRRVKIHTPEVYVRELENY